MSQVTQGSAQCNGAPIQFRKYVLESIFPRFRSEGVTAFDVNNTGSINIVTRQFWYESDLVTRHPVSGETTTWAYTDYSNSYANWGGDIDGDGWTDLLVLPRQQQNRPDLDPIYWFRNPQGEDRVWDRFMVAPRTVGERPVYEDLFRDGQKELVFTACEAGSACDGTKTLVWAVPDPADPTLPWVTTAISDIGARDAIGMDHHGMGLGDINGDGLKDIIVAKGWFENPGDRSLSPWEFHRLYVPPNDRGWLATWCRDDPQETNPESCCSDMFAYQVANGPFGILCSRPHNRGRWFMERLEDGTFAEHPMDPEPLSLAFSESHAARFEDLDGDGVPEFITGKRKYAHGTGGEGYSEPGVLVYYKLRPDGTGTWDRYDIDPEQASGVGTQFEVKDVNGDGFLDVIVSNKTGLYYFEQIPTK